MLACGMVRTDRDPPCGRPSARRISNRRLPEEGCCDDCFGDMLRSGDFTYDELGDVALVVGGTVAWRGSALALMDHWWRFCRVDEQARVMRTRDLLGYLEQIARENPDPTAAKALTAALDFSSIAWASYYKSVAGIVGAPLSVTGVAFEDLPTRVGPGVAMRIERRGRTLYGGGDEPVPTGDPLEVEIVLLCKEELAEIEVPDGMTTADTVAAHFGEKGGAK